MERMTPAAGTAHVPVQVPATGIATRPDAGEGRLWKPPFVFALLVSTIVACGHYIFMAVLPGYALGLGGGPGIAGAIMGVYSFSALLARPVSGRLMDTLGRRAVMTAGVVLFLAGSIALGHADRTWLLVAVRVLQGLGFGAVSSSIAVIVADLSPSRRLAEGLGWLQACNSAMLAAGPPVGLAVVAAAGHGTLFPLVSVLIGAAAAIGLLVDYPGDRPRSDAGTARTRARSPDARGKTGIAIPRGTEQEAPPGGVPALAPGILWIAGINLFMTLGLGTIFSFAILHGTGLGIRETGLYFPCFALASIVAVRAASGAPARRFGTERLLAAGLAATTLAYLLLGMAGSSLSYLASALILGAGSGIAFTMCSTLLMSGTSRENRGLSNAIGYAAFDIGIGAGSVLGGMLALSTGYGGLFLAASGTTVVALAILAIRGRAGPPLPLPRDAAPAQREALRRIPVGGMHNLRDLGGYPAADGRRVKWGVLYRSDVVRPAGARDRATIGMMRLATVVDFRSTEERRKSPDMLPGESHVRLVPIPVFDGPDSLEPAMRAHLRAGTFGSLDAARLSRGAYEQLPVDYLPQFRAFLREILDAAGAPVLFHCSAGKDRTGFAAALLLRLLDVPLPVVYDDYLLSRRYSVRFGLPAVVAFRVRYGEAAYRVLRRFMSIEREYLEAAFAVVDARYGSFRDFVRRGLLLDDADLSRLKDALLTDTPPRTAMD